MKALGDFSDAAYGPVITHEGMAAGRRLQPRSEARSQLDDAGHPTSQCVWSEMNEQWGKI
jgi:hypothetical protein